MNRTIEEKNKVLVLKAFDTLFNKRDYVAAEQYLATALHPAQRSYRTSSCESVQSHQEPATHVEVRAGNDRG
jgi:primosomal protein N'